MPTTSSGRVCADPQHEHLRRRRSGGDVAGGSVATTTVNPVLELQRSVGNRATGELIEDRPVQPTVTPAGGTSGSGLVQRNRRRRKKKPRKGGRQRQQPQSSSGQPAATTTTATATQEPAQAESQGWGAWFGGLLSSGLSSTVKPASANSGDAMLPGRGGKLEGTLGEFNDADDEPVDAEALFGIPEVSLTLYSGNLDEEVAGAKVEGAYELKRLLDGYEGTGKLEVSHGTARTVTTDEVKVIGSTLKGTFTAESFHGAKAGLKGKATATDTSMALRAEANAFIGQEWKGSTKLHVNIDGQDVATFDGGAGIAIGVGGELKGHISYTAGKLRFGSKGALSAGAGVSWEYKLDLDSGAIATGLWSRGGDWGRWLWDNAGSLGDALLDEDGEPLMIL